MIEVREIDLSERVVGNSDSQMLFTSSARKESKRKIIRMGRFYTWDKFKTLAPSAIPRLFKFNSKRHAKRFFAFDPMLIGSEKQMTCVFGAPDVSKPFDSTDFLYVPPVPPADDAHHSVYSDAEIPNAYPTNQL